MEAEGKLAVEVAAVVDKMWPRGVAVQVTKEVAVAMSRPVEAPGEEEVVEVMESMTLSLQEMSLV